MNVDEFIEYMNLWKIKMWNIVQPYYVQKYIKYLKKSLRYNI